MLTNRTLPPHRTNFVLSIWGARAAIRRRCGGCCTKARNAASSFHAESVQNRFENGLIANSCIGRVSYMYVV
jgi:hypothetical protein